MDDLSVQISSGLPKGWVPLPHLLTLPENTVNAYSASNGVRRLMFLRVKGPLTSAMPLFNANSEIRKSGFETVWLFEDDSIPSTKHMPCASIRMLGSKTVATITNVGQDNSMAPQIMDLAILAKAAAEKRMRVSDFKADCKVNVTFTSDEAVCTKCGAVSFDVQRATFHPTEHPGAPGLELSKSKIGRNVATLICNALKSSYPAPFCICTGCKGEHSPAHLADSNVTRTLRGIALSKLASFELLRHNTTVWYVT